MRQPAIVLANGHFLTANGKTAHGLVRGSDRFEVVAVVDPAIAGRDAGEALDGRHRGIPGVATIEDGIGHAGTTPPWCVVGIATHGGRFTREIHALLLEALHRGMSIVNGLHDAAAEDAELAAAAAERGLTIVDLRRAKPRNELRFWEGDILAVHAPRVAVLGTDCALGKRTTTRLLVQALEADGLRAEMIYTGQTGWMQGARYGFVFDSTINDYVSGELERAIVDCDREARPDVMVLEGQSSLRNPSGPCGAEFLLSARARGVVLQHAPAREFFEGYEALGLRIPPLESEVELIGHYGSRVIAVTLNGKDATPEALARFAGEYREKLGVPVVDVLTEGLEPVIPAVRAFIRDEQARAAVATG